MQEVGFGMRHITWVNKIPYLACDRYEFLNFAKCKCSDLFPYTWIEVEFVTCKKFVFALRTFLTRRLLCIVNYLMMD